LVNGEVAVAEIEAASELRAAVDLQCGGACGGRGEGCGSAGVCKRANVGALGGLYRARRGGGAMVGWPGVMAINGPGGGGGFKAFKRGKRLD
jgi:hypothetical protein